MNARVTLFVLVFAVLSAPVLAAPKQDPEADIAAVVAGDAISSWDVANRLKFIIVTAKLSNTPDVVERIRPQVIRSLIDEKLELQEAAKNDIKVSDDDITHAIAAIEAERSMPPGAIDHILQDNDVPKSTFIQQIHAQLAWNKLLSQKVRPKVKVSDEEIALASSRAILPPAKPQASSAPQELKIGVITLPVDKASRAGEMQKLGEKLVREIRGGASFEEISRQFSSATAEAGGKVENFWIKPGQLDANVARALAGADKGAIAGPVPTREGFTIIKVYDTRAVDGAAPQKPEPEAEPADSDVTLKQILLKLKPEAANKEAEMLLQIGEDVAKHPGTCQEKGIAGVENLEDVDIEVDFRKQRLSELPPALKLITDHLKIGDISTPFASDDGIRLYMLCDKKTVDAKTPSHEQVYRMLMQQKMELEAQKYLRNLRREAFVEVR